MKRVKFMLTAITVFAVVGGALAFKAQKFNSVCYYESNSPAQICPLLTEDAFIKTTAQDSELYATTAFKVAGQCPVRSCPTSVITDAAEN
jgi:hypothetical protein